MILELDMLAVVRVLDLDINMLVLVIVEVEDVMIPMYKGVVRSSKVDGLFSCMELVWDTSDNCVSCSDPSVFSFPSITWVLKRSSRYSCRSGVVASSEKSDDPVFSSSCCSLSRSKLQNYIGFHRKGYG